VRLWRRGPSRRAEEPGASVEWLVAGLGNPGPRYEDTRHNMGRRALLRLAAARGVALDQIRMRCRLGSWHRDSSRVVLATPTTYMNESGQAIGPLARFFKLPPERVLLVYDDIDLPLGTLRVRAAGGAGGHNGVASVLAALGSAEVPRVRLGIGRPPPGWDPADYVLARFLEAELPAAEELADRAVEAVEAVLTDGLDSAMNRYN
jgi:PTH1 family peptidyl-tRNA hydrolase